MTSRIYYENSVASRQMAVVKRETLSRVTHYVSRPHARRHFHPSWRAAARGDHPYHTAWM